MNGKSLFYIALDIAIVLGGLSFFLLMINRGHNIANVSHNANINKKEIVTTYNVEEYNGFNNEGTIIYDGELSGASVLNDILAQDDDTTIYIIERGGNRINLSNENYNGVALIEYAKTTDTRKLSDKLEIEQNYLRMYEKDLNGKTESVTYKLQNY